MEVLAVLVAAVGGLYALTRVPFARWRFEWEGRRVEIRNYLLREKVWIDGVEQRTDRKMDWSSLSVEHRVEVDGVRLRVWIATEGGTTLKCRVDDGRRVLFQSGGLPPLLDEPAPEPAAVDERLSAARILLASVAKLDPGAAREMEAALVKVLDEERAAVRAAEAHVALGGTREEAEAVRATRERAVGEVLATLRALHLQTLDAAGPEARPALDRARDALRRLEAAREVEHAARRSAARISEPR